MQRIHLLIIACSALFCALTHPVVCEEQPDVLSERSPISTAQFMGRIADERLFECSGMDISLSDNDFFWALNDGENGPFIYAVGKDGSDLGRVKVAGAHNRDWEGLDTFLWKGQPMILIADIGDNMALHDTHTLYIVKEPRLPGKHFNDSDSVDVVRHIVFSYPDQNHDAECVAVDTKKGKILVLTKRDKPPLLYELPLEPLKTNQPVIAKKVTSVSLIPQPTKVDLKYKYGKYRSQPTALDISPDGQKAVVLTYKHAYMFSRASSGSWAAAFNEPPVLLPLPLPQDQKNLEQREAICFAPDGMSLYVTSEGKEAGIFRLDIR